MSLEITITNSADTDAAAAAYLQINSTVLAHDNPGFPIPTPRMAELMHKHPWPGHRIEQYTAWLDDAPVGRLEIGMPTIDNLQNAFIEIEVVPAHRRKGIGRALYEKAVARVHANGRKTLMAHSCWSLPELPARDGGAGPAFAQAMGFNSANLPEVMRRFDLSTLDRPSLDAILEKAKAKSDGYRLERWKDSAPERYVDDVAYLDSRLVEDAPMGDLAWEPEKVDAQRVRDNEKVVKVRGRVTYHTGVVHEETDKLVAWTTLSRDAELDWHAWQQITIVEPRHRGHRLGALVKVENLDWFLREEPTIKVIDTFNAAVNSYMISINEDMGFRPLYAFQNWQLTLDGPHTD